MEQQHGAAYTPTTGELKRSLDAKSGSRKRRGPAAGPPEEGVSCGQYLFGEGVDGFSALVDCSNWLRPPTPRCASSKRMRSM